MRAILKNAKPEHKPCYFDFHQPKEGKGVFTPEKFFSHNLKYDNIQPNGGKGVYLSASFKEQGKNHKEISHDPKKLGKSQVVQITVYERQSLQRLVKIITGNFFRFSKMQAIQKLGKKASKESLECLCSIALRNKAFEWQGAQMRLFSKDEFIRLEAINSIALLYSHFPSEAISALKNAKEGGDFRAAARAEYSLKKLIPNNGISKNAEENQYPKKIKMPKTIRASEEFSITEKLPLPKKKRIYPHSPLTEHIISTNYQKYI